MEVGVEFGSQVCELSEVEVVVGVESTMLLWSKCWQDAAEMG
jgi:hypothetical protein